MTRMFTMAAALACALVLSGCATTRAALFSPDVSLVNAALLVQAVREAEPDVGDFDTRLAAYASVDCLRIAIEAERRACVVRAVSSLGDRR